MNIIRKKLKKYSRGKLRFSNTIPEGLSSDAFEKDGSLTGFQAGRVSLKDALTKIEAKQAKRVKLRRILPFLRILLASALVTLIFVVVALLEGVGYAGSAKLTSTRLQVKDHPCAGVVCAGYINISYNPFLYPISHATTNGRVRTTFQIVYYPPSTNPLIPTSAELGVMLTASLAWAEMSRSLPYFLILGLIVGLVILKVSQAASSKIKRGGKATEPQAKTENGYTR